MNISISFDSDKKSKSSGREKKSLHRKPWFWLLIILTASVAVRISSRNQPKLPFLDTEEEDTSSSFSFNPDDEKFTIKEEKSIAEDNGDYTENESEEQVNTTENKYLSEENKTGKSVFRFIINTATKKYHTKECGAVKKLAEEKRMDTDIEADSMEEAKEIIEAQGYDLCGLCDR